MMLKFRFVNWIGDVCTIADVYAASTTIAMSGKYSITTNFGVNPIISARYKRTIGLKSDGTVVAVGLEVELAKWNLIEAAP